LRKKTKKRKVWHTYVRLETCRKIFDKEIPVYASSFIRKNKIITGEINTDGSFWLAFKNRRNKNYIKLLGFMQESDDSGTEMTIKYNHSLLFKIINAIPTILLVLILLFGFPIQAPIIPAVVIFSFKILSIILYHMWTKILLNQVKDMFNIEWKNRTSI